MKLSPLTINEFFGDPAAPDLLAEYAEECRLAGFPEPEPHRAIYEALEKAGVLTMLGARVDGKLIGFLALLVSMNPHYSQIIGATESIFVSEPHRKTGAGLALLKEAQRLSRERGAVGFLVSAPVNGPLAALLAGESQRRNGWDYVNRVFLKVLG